MCIAANPAAWTRIFALLIFLSAFVFAPAMLILSSLEAWRGGSATYNFYTLSSGSMSPGNIMPTTNPYQAKFALPLVIAILAGIIILMTSFIALNLCCCMNTLGIYVPAAPPPAPPVVINSVVPPPEIITKEIYYQPRPQVRTAINYQVTGDVGTFDPFLNTPVTRYTSVPNPFGSNVMYGNMASQGSTSFVSNLWKWQ